MRFHPSAALIALAALGCAAPGPGATDQRAPLLGSVAHRLASRHVGDEFQLTVVLPRSYGADSTRRFPVVYLLDGNWVAPAAAGLAFQLADEGVPQVILVGIDYPVASFEESADRRFRDLTPTPDTASLRWLAPLFEQAGFRPPTVSGGGAAFLRFIAEEAVPFIDGRYRTVPGDRTLLGVSLGGLFTLYTITERPDAFRRYVAISPSLWWDPPRTLGPLEAFARRPRTDSLHLFISVGLAEGNVPPTTMVGNVQTLERMLRAGDPAGLAWHVQYFPDETHGSSWPGAMSRGLRYVFGAWTPDGIRPPRR